MFSLFELYWQQSSLKDNLARMFLKYILKFSPAFNIIKCQYILVKKRLWILASINFICSQIDVTLSAKRQSKRKYTHDFLRKLLTRGVSTLLMHAFLLKVDKVTQPAGCT